MIAFKQRIPFIFGRRKAIESLIASAKENTWSRAYVNNLWGENAYLLIEAGTHDAPQFAFLYNNGAIIRVADLTRELRGCSVHIFKDARIPCASLSTEAKDRIDSRAVWCVDHPEDSRRILYVHQVQYDGQYLTARLHNDWHNAFRYQLQADDVWCGLDNALEVSRVSSIL